MCQLDGGGGALSVKKKRKKKKGELPGVGGYRFWYWRRSESKSPRSEKWFVPQRFDNLKEEVLQHDVHPLATSKWDAVYNKGLHLRKSHVIKSMHCETDKYQSTYGITQGSPLKMEHILAVTLYTDFCNLAHVFTASFTKMSHEESGEAVVARHSAFANWARLLRETVECFGSKMKTTKTDIFYRVVDDQYTVQSVTARFYPPTSTTTQLAVAPACGSRGTCPNPIKLSERACSLRECSMSLQIDMICAGSFEFEHRAISALIVSSCFGPSI